MLYGPVILQVLVWRQRRTKDRHAERILLVTAHCCGGTQRGLLTASKQATTVSMKQKCKTHNKNQSHGSIKLGYSCMKL